MKSFLFLIFLSFLMLDGIYIEAAGNKKRRLETRSKDKVLSPNDGELIFAHVIHRHGDRNILFPYKNDIYTDEEIHWPEGYGQLTRVGKWQTFQLGQFLRRRYNRLLGKKYSPNKVYVRSTDVDRTLMSAQANLAGLFPPTTDEIWNKNIPWQPIPVHTIPSRFDNILFHDSECPKYDAAIQKYMKESQEVQQIYRKYADKFAYWSRMSGANITTIADVFELYGIFYVETMQNKPLPDWAKKEFEANGAMEYISKFKLSTWTKTNELTRLKVGFLLKEMFERFAQKINNTLKPDRSLHIYSGHEVTIANVLSALGVFEPHVPAYASSLHLELYKNAANEHYVQLFYRKSQEEHLSPMNIPNCGVKFSLDRLNQLCREIIPIDNSECF